MNIDDPPNEGFYVSTESHLLNRTWVANTLLETYWGSWRTHDLIVESIQNSLCFGLYLHSPPPDPSVRCIDRQVGFGRIVTDYATFSWICDVVVDPAFRGRKLGKFLVQQMVAHPVVARTVCLLRTKDAQGLYAKFGFEAVDAMRRIPLKKAP